MKRKNGMTLIPLILTIIILIIVSTVAIKISIDQGIFDIAKKSASEYNTSKDLEQIRLAYSLYHTEKDNLDTNQVVFDKIKNSLDFEGATYTIASQYMNIVKNDGTSYTLLIDGTVIEGRIAYLDIKYGTIQIKNNGYIQGEAELIEHTGKYILTGTSTKDTVKIIDIGTYDITLKDLNIDVSSINSAAAFDANVTKNKIGCYVTITIEGENKLSSGKSRTGLAFNGATANMNGIIDGSTLTITGDGYLEAIGGSWGAGIGGDCYNLGNNITINSGNIIARGGLHGAGIGTGLNGKTYCVNINGGNIKCYGNYSGPGIGLSDANRNYGAITINGGEIYLTGPSCIGGSYLQDIVITGGLLHAEQVGSANVWKRAAFCADNILIEGGTIVAHSENVSAIFSSLGNITIKGGNILANGIIPMGKVVQDSETLEEKLGEAIPSNGEKELYLTPIKLQNVGNNTQIISLKTSDNLIYGTKDMYTLDDGILYLYLPEGSRTITISTKDKTYSRIVTTTKKNDIIILSETN